MSHLLHHTSGFILQSRDFGESNRCYWLLTRDHGLIITVAQSVRELRSKLRYQLRDFAELRLTLVRGREVWRLTAVELFDGEPLTGVASRRLLKKVFALLCRLAPTDESSPGIFNCLRQTLSTLCTAPTLAPTELYQLELQTVLTVLHELGYLPAAAVPREANDLEPGAAVALINRALHNSML